MLRQTFFAMALVGLLAACGDTREDREASGAMSGALVGAILGPVGAIIGAGAGYASGSSLDKSADKKIEELANQPQNGSDAAPPEPKPRPADSPPPSRIMTSAQIESRLNDAGYKPVHAIQRHGDDYVAQGEREGTLYRVKVDAATGRLLASHEIGIVRRPTPGGDGTRPAIMTEQQIRTTLRQNGYEMVGDVERAGPDYRAEAMRDGRVYDVVVDGRTGRVVNSNPPTPGDAAPPISGRAEADDRSRSREGDGDIR